VFFGRQADDAQGAAECVTLAEDREPAQAGLEAFEAQLLEQPVIVGDGHAPLVVVIGAILR
jgi:hypothetical protein